MTARSTFHIVLLITVFAAPGYAADQFIVENGIPKAVIVISRNPTRMQRVAAHEFRMQIEKISGARLPIVNIEFEMDMRGVCQELVLDLKP